MIEKKRVKRYLKSRGYKVVEIGGDHDFLAYKEGSSMMIKVLTRKPSDRQLQKYIYSVEGPIPCEIWVVDGGVARIIRRNGEDVVAFHEEYSVKEV